MSALSLSRARLSVAGHLSGLRIVVAKLYCNLNHFLRVAVLRHPSVSHLTFREEGFPASSPIISRVPYVWIGVQS